MAIDRGVGGGAVGAPGAEAAGAIANTPSGNISATNMQDAINELDGEKLAKASNLSDLANLILSRSNLGLGSIALQSASSYTGVTDLSANSTGLGASLVGIEDAAANYTATDVEAALAEVYDTAIAGTGSVVADVGDADKTLTAGTDAVTQIWATELTAPRTVSLSLTGATNGDKFRLVRACTATGAFELIVAEVA